jgi:prolyl 4-hydroxylase
MDRPYLLLAPFKVEIVRFNPLAVLFRNVINDEEIERIQVWKSIWQILRLAEKSRYSNNTFLQELSKPKLARATVQNSQTGQLETASYRISKRLAKHHFMFKLIYMLICL